MNCKKRKGNHKFGFGGMMEMIYIAKDIPLWQVTIWDKKFNNVDKKWQPKTIKYKYLLSDELDSLRVDDGDVRILYTGKDVGFTTEELAGDRLSEGEIISIPWGGIPTVKYHKGKFVTGDNRIATSKDINKLTNKYLYYFMRGNIHEIASYYRGASLKHPCMKDILKMTISYPSVQEQNKICGQFDVLEQIIEVRKQELQLLDDLIKARFVELFGNPEINDMNWDEHKLSDELSVIGGYAFKSDSFQENGIPVLRIGNINAGVFRPINLVFWKKDDTLFKYLMYPGDLVMSLTGTVGKDDYGNVCILGSEYEMYYLNQRNAKLELKDGLDKYYLAELLKFPQIKKRLTGISRGVRQANISNKDILDLSVPIPPMKLQQQFADFVTQVDKSKVAVQKALDETQMLFDSLMQKYFG